MTLLQDRQTQTVRYQDAAFAGVVATLKRGASLAQPTLLTFAGMSRAALAQAATELAVRLDRPLLRVDLGGVASRYIGETEKNLGRVFASAQASGAILLFDEADALFGRRTGVQDAHGRFGTGTAAGVLPLLLRHRVLAIVIDDAPGAPGRPKGGFRHLQVKFPPA